MKNAIRNNAKRTGPHRVRFFFMRKENIDIMHTILVTEHIHESGMNLLSQARDVSVSLRIGLDRTALLEAVSNVDAMLTRSGTPLDREIFDRAPRLRVVARAGVGVDNIDIAEASRRGIVIINAPTGNTLAATEHTMAMMLSAVRRLPHAHASVMNGEWRRKDFMGNQLHGRKLLIVGLGRIGSQVAIRARGFGMEVFAFDPYVSEAHAERIGAKLLENLDGALALADIVTLHVPLTSETRGMIGERELKSLKCGAFLVNCARGNLVDEDALARELRNGRIAGVAFDVFGEEPIRKDHPLLAEDVRDKVVVTPHIGANTHEAQSAVARIAVENMLSALRGEAYEHAVNLPFMAHGLPEHQRQYLSLARRMGIIAARLLSGAPQRLNIRLLGRLFTEDAGRIHFELPYRHSSYAVSILKGFLEVHLGPEVNYMSAPLLAQDRSLRVEESRGTASTYNNIVEVSAKSDRDVVTISATVTEENKLRIVGINGYWIDFVPEGTLLLFSNHDRPGVIGRIGTLLGNAGVNIANFALGRKNGNGLALGVLQVDSAIPDDLLQKLRSDSDFVWATTVTLTKDAM
jgi:D-3-phosphoglycerate dehydrogenase